MIDCIIDNIIFSLQRSGGISILWRNLIKRLVRDRRFNARFIEYDNASENVIRESFLLSPKIFLSQESSFALQLKRYINTCNNQISSPYIFHSSYYRTDSNKNAINITTVHDFIYEKYATPLRRFVHKTQKWNAIRNSDAIICISDNTKRDLLEYMPDIDERKITVVYNGVDTDYRIIKSNRNQYFIPYPDKEYVLYVGSRNAQYKNFGLVVKACARLNLPLVLTGGGRLTKHEHRLLESELGKGNYLKTGIVATKTLNELYNNALALVYPSKYEGFGLPIVEAQRAGCPVVAFNDSSIPEVMGNGGFCIDDKSETGIEKTLNFIHDNPEKVRQIVSLGLENSQRFSWDKTYYNTIGVYSKIWEEKTGLSSNIPY